ncbi:MAG: hypothetical protein AB1Z67_03925 [Candidatus Limnocylindrales bacterium]
MSDAHTTHAISEEHDDGHGHGPTGDPLGPIDWETWVYAGAGALLGVLVVLALVIARGG